MNIFILDTDIRRCAEYHCDQHVVKMILESVQILCTALNEKGLSTPYRSTHSKHPCVLWAGQSYDNFSWLQNLAVELNREFRYRFEKDDDHQSMGVLDQISNYSFESKGLTEFPQAMPDQFKVPGDPVRAYRRFYVGEKLAFARWTRRDRPSWIPELEAPESKG